MVNKYVVRRYEPFREERVNTRKEARRLKKEMQEEAPGEYCHYFKVSFIKRHPDFPLWFQTVTLLILILPSILDWCTRRILQIMQLLQSW